MFCIFVCFILCPTPKHRLQSYKILPCFIGHEIFPSLMSNCSEDSAVYKLQSCYGIRLLIRIVHLQYSGMPGGGNTLK